jgi:hypothetical protein
VHHRTAQHGGAAPTTRADKTAFRATVTEGARGEETNYEEAAAKAHLAFAASVSTFNGAGRGGVPCGAPP